LFNFKKKDERNVLLVVPQFISGILFTYIFVRYGLVTTILAHFFFNAVLFSALKEKMPNKGTLKVLAFYVVVGVLFAIGMGIRGLKVSDLAPWLTTNTIASLANYSFIDYVALFVFVDCIVVVIASLLLLDPISLDGKTVQTIIKYGPIGFLLIAVLTAVIHVAMVLFGNWALSLVVKDLLARILILTIALAITTKTTSGSALTRRTIVYLPTTFLSVAIMTTLGFWYAFGLSLVFFLVHFLPATWEADDQVI